MDEISVFVLGQSQEQINSRYKFDTEENRVLYEALRTEIYNNSLIYGNKLNLYTNLDRGIGFTTLIAGISLNNEHSKLSQLVVNTVVLPHASFTNKWNYRDAMKYDELLTYADSVRTSSRADKFTQDDLVKSGKYMVDNCSVGIIILPDNAPNYLLEVVRYAFHKKIKLIKVNKDLTFSNVELTDIMI